MHILRRFLVAVLASIGICVAQAGEELVDWHGTKIRTYIVDPKDIDLYWKKSDGTLFRQISVLNDYLVSKGERVQLLMNAGLFEEHGDPCGLLVVDGKVKHPLNEKDGIGNFYLKPNGVFFIDQNGAQIVSSTIYAGLKYRPRLAVQSGPLLLQNDVIHPAFRRESKNLLHRNGVGILPDGRVLFAITVLGQAQYINLYQFAEFFRGQGCQDALFLDGDLSQMEVDPPRFLRPSNFLGALFAVSIKD